MRHSHVGKEGILLEEVSHPPPLRRQVHPGGTVVEHPAVQLNVPLVRPQDARYALEGHGLAASRGSQQSQCLSVLRPEGGLQGKAPQSFADLHCQSHQTTPFFVCRWLRSSRFTASSTTVEMARFTSTQRKARASLLVRQS